MSDQNNVYKLKEILARTNEELTSNWSRLASLIKNYEKMEWREAQKLASQLIKDGKATDYVIDVRKKTASKKASAKKKKTSPSKKSPVKRQKQTKVVPIGTGRDRFHLNYKRLLRIAPDLENRLDYGEQVQGISSHTGFDDFNIELVKRNKLGFYLALSHVIKVKDKYVPDPLMYVLFDPDGETLEALSFKNQMYERQVYDDIYRPILTNEKEKRSQNAFLEKWLLSLIEQDRKIDWLHEQEVVFIPAGNIGKKNDKPDISYMEDDVIAEPKELVEKGILDDVVKLYTAHQEGSKKLGAITLYFVVDRLNNSPVSNGNSYFAYPTEQELRDNYEQIKAFKTKELEADTLLGIKKPDISFVPDQLRKSMTDLMADISPLHAKVIYAAHKKGKPKIDALFLFFIVEKINESYEDQDIPYPTISQIKAVVEEIKPNGYDKAMDELKQEVELTERAVYGELAFKLNYNKLLNIAPNLLSHLPKNGELVGNTSKRSNDLNLLVEDSYNGGYLISLLESKGSGEDYIFGLMMKVFFSPKTNELRAIATYDPDGSLKEVYADSKTFEKVDFKEEKAQNQTLGKWLDQLHEQGHKIDKLIPIKPETGEMPEEVKKPVKPKGDNQNLTRLQKANYNQLLKTNFQKLLRFVPNLFEIEEPQSATYFNPSGDKIEIKALKMKGGFAHVFELTQFDTMEIWTIHVQKLVQKLMVKSFSTLKEPVGELSPEELNKRFGKWLNKKIKEGYQLPVNQTQKLLEKYPIILEWTEATNDENIGFRSLEKLRTKLKGYGFTGRPTETYIKNKLWFRGYPHYVRIDLSKVKGDYNPNEENLLDWLKEYDPDFDWSQFSRPRAKKKDKTPPKKSRKELQKEVENEIPDFEPGKVKLMPAHIKRGIKQKHIDWINKNKQGMTITPINRMVNNTEDFFSDMTRKAKKPGFRISRTGKLYYETRSNRSDITGKNL